MLALAFALFAQGSEDPHLLAVGETFEAEVTNADALVRTPTLDAGYRTAPTVGQTLLIEVEEPGTYTIELLSYAFDSYLVLRGANGAVLAEDDDGFFGLNSRVTFEARAGVSYEAVACALHGRRGIYEIQLLSGSPTRLAAEERTRLDLEDARHRVEYAEECYGPDHPETANVLHNVAEVFRTQGLHAEARSLFERALAIREKALEPDHLSTAASLNQLGLVLQAQGHPAEARSLFERALEINETVLGPGHAQTGNVLSNLGAALMDLGQYSGAQPLLEQVVVIREKTVGPEHPQTARSLNNLGAALGGQGRPAEARPFLERALEINEKTFGPNHPETFLTLNNLGTLLLDQGHLAEARPLLERALEITEETFGPGHPKTLLTLNNLGSLLLDQGHLAEARPLLERALEITEETFGPGHPKTAGSLALLGRLLWTQGLFPEARSLWERSLEIYETTLGPNDAWTARVLGNLGVVLHDQGQCSEARPLLERALEIKEQTLGPEHPEIPSALSGLAGVLRDQGLLAEARQLYERALEVSEKAFGPEHPRTATNLNNLGVFLRSQGLYAEARSLLERALETAETALGPDHPTTAHILHSLAGLLADMGASREAWELARRSENANRARARILLVASSERERYSYLANQRCRLELAQSIALEAQAPREGWEALLAWKGQVARLARGRIFDAQMLAPEQLALLEELRDVQEQLSTTFFGNQLEQDLRKARLEELEADRNRLELRWQREFGIESEEAELTHARFVAALPRDTAVLDFFVARPFVSGASQVDTLGETGAAQAAHLLCWVVRPDREPVQVDLGPAPSLEESVQRLHRGLAAQASAARSGRGIGSIEKEGSGWKDDLRERLWDPLVPYLGEPKTVIVSPDGFVGTLPFEILQGADGRFLAEDHAFVYLSDLSALLENREPTDGACSLLAVGGVDYSLRAPMEEAEVESPKVVSAGVGETIQRGSLGSWERLAGTASEIAGIEALHQDDHADARRLLLTGPDATEERVIEELQRHSVVHLATHGFFEPEGMASMWESAKALVDAQMESGGDISRMRAVDKQIAGNYPGLLSGLVLAGVNTDLAPGRADGYLTAEEVSWLDLSGCDLIVLSACETGLGRARSGEGLMGLRRMLTLAGAATVISSLWSVDDAATKELMTRFYSNLWHEDMGKLEALRAAQLWMLERNRKEKGHPLPHTWGAFVLSGEWR